MRILPDVPNVDFLRREAKTVLAALRERDQTVTLTIAQRHVAEQYGLRSWPELRAEVERRRSNPPHANPLLADSLTAAFGLGTTISPMSPIAYTIMGRRWRLDTDLGSWIATPVFDWIDESQIERATELRERARSSGVLAPAPVRTADGALLHRIDGQGWRVDKWIRFGPELLQPVSSSVAREVGRTLATLHAVGAATSDVFAPGQTGHLSSRHSAEDWAQLIGRTARAGVTWLEDLVDLRLNVLEPLETIPFRPASENLTVCINDLSIGTVRMGPHDELVLLHWDFAGSNLPEWELAYVLTHWAGHPPVNRGTARALVEGYREKADCMPPLDRSSFWPAITANLNWTYNQFCFGLDRTGEHRSYAEGELRQLVADPMSLAMVDRILAEIS